MIAQQKTRGLPCKTHGSHLVVSFLYVYVSVLLWKQALHGHISTGQAGAGNEMAAMSEAGNAGHELIHLQVIYVDVCTFCISPYATFGFDIVRRSESKGYAGRYNTDHVHMRPFSLCQQIFDRNRAPFCHGLIARATRGGDRA